MIKIDTGVRLLVALAMTAATGTPWAQAAEPERLDEVVVEAESERRLQNSRRDIEGHPGAATIVSEMEIKRLKPLSTIDVLKTLPGIYAPDEFGRGLRPNIGFRGLDPSRSKNGTLLLADGAPIQPALYGDRSAYYNVPVEAVERIEVIRGGSSVLYGPDTIGGVVNYITRRPPEESQFRLRETVRQGSFFSTYFSYGGSNDDGSGALFSYANKSGETVRENTDTEAHDATLKFTTPFGRGDLWFRMNYYREIAQTPGGLSVAQFEDDPEQSVRSNDIFKGRRGSFDVHLNQPVGEASSFESLVYLNFFERNWYIADAPDASATSNTQFLREFFVFGAEPRFRTEGFLGGDWVTGTRVHFENMNDVQRMGATPDTLNGTTTSESDQITRAIAGYVEAEYRVDRLTVIPGIRQEWVEQEINVGLRGGSGGESGRATTQETVGGLGLTYDVWRNGNVYANVHRTFSPPQFSQAVDPTTGTDRDLDSATGTNYEIGYRGALHPTLGTDVAAFFIDFDNQIVSESGKLVNGGETSHKGVEASVDYRPSSNWLFDASYTHVDAEFEDGANEGNQLPMSPENSVSWGASYSPFTNAWLRIDGRFVDERFSDAVNTVAESANGNVGLLPSYDVWNVRADYGFDRWLVFVGVNNVLNEEYRERRQSLFNGIIPGLTRTVYGGVEVTF